MLYEEALEVIDKGLKSNPREGTFYSMKTEILFRQGKIKEALITCDKGIKIGKKYKGTTIDIADLYGRLGNIFKQKKAYKKAINAFQKALEF
ncbi:MAG: tetratricopeptide repeat protein [Candidatus Peribacteria bacterium]|jgi:tetratricopeptide (TPR) repeat protein|nr:tetratricopeptide repeat protein [Candidatus Peribacteria bacterium]